MPVARIQTNKAHGPGYGSVFQKLRALQVPDLVLYLLNLFRNPILKNTVLCQYACQFITDSISLPWKYLRPVSFLFFFHFKRVKICSYFFLHWLLLCIPDCLIYHWFPFSWNLLMGRGQHNKFFTGSGIFGQRNHYRIRALGCELFYKDLLVQGPLQEPVLKDSFPRTELLKD